MTVVPVRQLGRAHVASRVLRQINRTECSSVAATDRGLRLEGVDLRSGVLGARPGGDQVSPVEQARVVDGHAEAFDHRTALPVVTHSRAEDPEAVLSAALADGWPVVVMGNANPAFVQELADLIEERAGRGEAADV